MRPFFISLHTKMVAGVVATLLMTVTLLTLFAVLSLDYYLERDMRRNVGDKLKGISLILEGQKKQAMAHATNLSTNPSIVSGVRERKIQTLLEITLPLMNNGELDYIVITDSKGTALVRAHEPSKVPAEDDNIANQLNISHALKGAPFVGIEEGRIVNLSIRGGAPIRDGDGNIIGAISTGYVISYNKIVDEAKKMFGSDVSLYQEDRIVATTLRDETGKPLVASLTGDKRFFQQIKSSSEPVITKQTILENEYITGYAPLVGANGQTIGMIFSAFSVKEGYELKSSIIRNIFFSSFFVLLFTSLFGYLFAFHFTQPLKHLQVLMDKAGKGDLSVEGKTTTNDEVGLLTNSFNQMIRQQAEAIKKQKLYMEFLGESERRLQQITSALGEGVCVLDHEGKVTFLNPEGERLLGWTEEELLGKQIHEIVHYQKMDGTAFSNDECPIYQTTRSGKISRVDLDYFIQKGGTLFPVSYVCTPLTLGGEIFGSVTAFQDITQRLKAEEQLRYQAYYDPLTGLPNRAAFQSQLEQSILEASRKKNLLAVFFVDLERFKLINDSLGHAIGDQLLKEVAKRLKENVTQNALVSRFTSGDFTIILPNLSSQIEALESAHTLVEILAKPFHLDAHEVFINSRIGISLYPSSGENGELLIKNADTALLSAKEQRVSYKIYDSSMEANLTERMTIETNLRKALERNEFILHYQPIVDGQTGRIIAMESLLRWQHEEWGMVSPARFIPIAEETGLIIPIGQWVLKTACAQNKAWQDAGLPPIRVGVNLSVRQFGQKNLPQLVESILAETGLEAKYLDLEITESISAYDVESIIGTLGELDKLGIEISVDDFGTGYSSLSYLKRFPIDTLKIDRSFVQEIAADKDGTIASAVIAMAHQLKLEVVAEGVETEDQLTFLRQHGCDRMQGYFFSRPLPAEDFSKLLAQKHKAI